MLEYAKKRLDELLDSLFNPLWQRILQSPWWLRLLVLLALVPVAYGLYSPQSAVRCWKLASAVVRVVRTPETRLPISAEIRNQVTEVTLRLAGTLEGDIAAPDRDEVNPWVLSQMILASQKLNTHLEPKHVVAYMRSKTASDCSCWRETHDSSRPHNIFISGWVLCALARIGEPATQGEIAFVLQQQSADGWWSVYPVEGDSPYASSYSTAWALVGLYEQLSGPFGDPSAAADVRAAIQKGSSWLLAHRQKGTRWKDYPLFSNGAVSESISGVVLHALHLTAQNRLKQIDAEWLDFLPAVVPATSDADHVYLWYKTREAWANDDYVQIRLPWLLVGTVDAYSNGDIFQRAKALLWIEETLSQPSVGAADTIADNWWRAETLYGLQYVLDRSATAGAKD